MNIVPIKAPSPRLRFLSDVAAGLKRPQKQLSPKYFYDERGSRLFDRITELEEYYPTRTELAILRTHAPEMAAYCGSQCLLVELGAGSLTKVRLLLDSLPTPAGYVPVDVSGEHLQAAAAELAEQYPSLSVMPLARDFTRPFVLPNLTAQRRVIYFPGSTIGNFDPPAAQRLLRGLVRMAGSGGGLLLGVDLRKNRGVLERAYNDGQGITAAFNLNILRRINRELGADFDLSKFKHRALYNDDQGRIEMHLVSLDDQEVHLDGETIRFRRGETIHTENSYKYDLDEFASQAAQCGWTLRRRWTDPQRYFAVLYLSTQPLS